MKMSKELKKQMAELGRAGAKKRWKGTTKEERSAAASKAAKARWERKPSKSSE